MNMEDGSLGIYKASLVSLEETGSAQDAAGRLSIANEEGEIGQTGRLRYRLQTEPYPLCIPAACIYEEDESWYVYVAEEQEGILGTEWRVRPVWEQSNR